MAAMAAVILVLSVACGHPLGNIHVHPEGEPGAAAALPKCPAIFVCHAHSGAQPALAHRHRTRPSSRPDIL